MTQKELDKKIKQLMSRFDDVNHMYIEKVAGQIMTIGELNASSINNLIIMAMMNDNIAAINHAVAQAAQMSVPALYQLYQDTLTDLYTDSRFSKVLRKDPLPEEDKQRLRQYTQAVSRQSAGTLVNLSNTTAVSQRYREAVDRAVLAVSSGLGDYKSATREVVRQIGYNGLQVQYESGYHRRLDTVVRQNIIDGVKQITQHGSDMMGEALGYDAKEISAHMRSAPDHEPVQGRVFLNEEFEKCSPGNRSWMSMGSNIKDSGGRLRNGTVCTLP